MLILLKDPTGKCIWRESSPGSGSKTKVLALVLSKEDSKECKDLFLGYQKEQIEMETGPPTEIDGGVKFKHKWLER